MTVSLQIKQNYDMTICIKIVKDENTKFVQKNQYDLLFIALHYARVSALEVHI